MSPIITTKDSLKDLHVAGKIKHIANMIHEEIGELIVLAEDQKSVIRRIISTQELDLFVQQELN